MKAIDGMIDSGIAQNVPAFKDKIHPTSSRYHQVDCTKQELIFSQGDKVLGFYKITQGIVKLYKLMSDGRRQIIGFLFAGDIFGLTLDQGIYLYSAESLTPASLSFYAYRSKESHDRMDVSLREALLEAYIKGLNRAQEQILLLGRKTAKEKLASFLLFLWQHQTQHCVIQNNLHLSMSRADIADYLGLTIETISRTFTQLKNEDIITLLSANEIKLNLITNLKYIADGHSDIAL